MNFLKRNIIFIICISSLMHVQAQPSAREIFHDYVKPISYGAIGFASFIGGILFNEYNESGSVLGYGSVLSGLLLIIQCGIDTGIFGDGPEIKKLEKEVEEVNGAINSLKQKIEDTDKKAEEKMERLEKKVGKMKLGLSMLIKRSPGKEQKMEDFEKKMIFDTSSDADMAASD